MWLFFLLFLGDLSGRLFLAVVSGPSLSPSLSPSHSLGLFLFSTRWLNSGQPAGLRSPFFRRSPIRSKFGESTFWHDEPIRCFIKGEHIDNIRPAEVFISHLQLAGLLDTGRFVSHGGLDGAEMIANIIGSDKQVAFRIEKEIESCDHMDDGSSPDFNTPALNIEFTHPDNATA